MGTRFKSSNPEHQIYEDAVLLHDSAGDYETATGTGAIEAEMPGNCRAILAHCECAPNGINILDLFDLYVQTLFTCSGVPTWIDAIHFQQITGNLAQLDLYDKIAISLDEGFFEIGTPLAVDTQRNLIGEKWRVRWVIAGPTPGFDFEVNLHPM